MKASQCLTELWQHSGSLNGDLFRECSAAAFIVEAFLKCMVVNGRGSRRSGDSVKDLQKVNRSR